MCILIFESDSYLSSQNQISKSVIYCTGTDKDVKLKVDWKWYHYYLDFAMAVH